MRSFFKNIFLIVGAIFFAAQTAFAMPEILPLDKVESGMTGTAYTIVDNSGKIEPFDVNIIGLMDNGKGSAKMIMAKASGSVIEKTGGVLQGMSGSPVYVDGKLVGALAAGLKEMSPYTFFITPIESMLKLWDMPDDKLERLKDGKMESDFESEESEKSFDETQVEKVAKSDEEIVSEEVESAEEKSALFFSGFDSNGLDFLKNEMRTFGFKNFFNIAQANSGDIKIKYDASLVPGGAMGVAVVFGDFLVGATGTVTAVDGNKILGFGHSFSHAGNVNFFMTDSAVIGSISGENGAGVKISSVGNIIGRINQDREAGVAGILGKFPSTVPITVNISDMQGATETYRATIAYNENLIPKLGASIAYTALSKTADSLAESTVDAEFKIKTNVTPSGIFERKNTFYNAQDTGQVAITELLQALNVICSNTTAESNIFGIEVNMRFDTARRTAQLISAKPDKKIVKPGETVNLTVQFQPYRKPIETIVVPYTVPYTRAPGPLTLDIHGGGVVPVSQVTVQSAGIITPSTSTPEQLYNEKIKSILNAGRNNQLVIEPGATPGEKPKDPKKEFARLKKLQEKLKKAGITNFAVTNNKIDTNYIIDNVIQCVVTVDKA